MTFKLDSQDDATKQACTHIFKSALRQYQYNLRKTHFEGKANSELSQLSPMENIAEEDGRGLVKLTLKVLVSDKGGGWIGDFYQSLQNTGALKTNDRNEPIDMQRKVDYTRQAIVK